MQLVGIQNRRRLDIEGAASTAQQKQRPPIHVPRLWSGHDVYSRERLPTLFARAEGHFEPMCFGLSLACRR